MADENISQGRRNAELTKKMAAWSAQPESGMNVQEEPGVDDKRLGKAKAMFCGTLTDCEIAPALKVPARYIIFGMYVYTQPKLGSAYLPFLHIVISHTRTFQFICTFFKMSKSHFP